MRLTSDPSSSRSPVYRTYFEGVTAASAGRILTLLGIAALMLEGAARLFPVHHLRTPISSLHGVRWIFQEASKGPEQKVIAVGDSALLGGGVHDHDKTFIGQLVKAESGHRQVLNLAVPGGDDATSLLLIDALSDRRVSGIDRVIIEILPGKFLAAMPGDSGAKPGEVDELRRFVPFIEPHKFGIATTAQTESERVEALLQYDLGLASAAYRDRDYLRIEEMGGYPAFWAVGRILPPRARTAVLSQKGHGTNRLGARLEDEPFDPSQRETGSALYFAEQPQGTFLMDAIEAAKKLTGKPPILLEFPMHYEYDRLSSSEVAQTLSSLGQVDGYLRKAAGDTGCGFVAVDSRTFQDPALWTRTAAHPNGAGQLEIWRRVGPEIMKALR